MSFLNVDYSNAGENKGKKEFQPIAEGTYEAIIKEVEVTQSKSGNDMIKVTLVIRDDVAQPEQKRKVWDYLVASEKATWKLNQVAKAIGMANGAKVSTIQEFAKSLLYSSVRIEIKHEDNEYNGEKKIQERVAKYSQPEQQRASASNPFDTSNIPF